MLKDALKVEHNVLVELFAPDGKLKQRKEVHNLVPTVGKNAVAEQLLAAPGKEPPTHMAIGTGETAAEAGDTKLKTELDRNALTSKTRATNVVTMVGDWAEEDGTGAITEAGLFNAAAEGDLYARAVFAVINKAADDTLKITWTLTSG